MKLLQMNDNPPFTLLHVYILQSVIDPYFLQFFFSDPNCDQYSNNHPLVNQALQNLWDNYMGSGIHNPKKK